MLADIDKHLRELNPFDLDLLGRIFDMGHVGPDDAFEDEDW